VGVGGGCSCARQVPWAGGRGVGRWWAQAVWEVACAVQVLPVKEGTERREQHCPCKEARVFLPSTGMAGL